MEGMFGGSSWLWIIVVGLVVGVLARLLKPGRDRMGLILTTLLGIGGALLAGWFGRTMGWYGAGEKVGFLASLVGAIVILLVVGMLRRR
ncbi:GlsB/YeaQ/YmgE family stress response membrane protein [uncultured Luteimonas sp.]|uniref:GlsB/YeaQ/YmgE family stress response membrane protein n=1 Tax=uncultured Luteimonas sp. TaxID=453144 RepID=UPI002628DF12|nr:GlsB/YeaQ/YmgE family stress response membrane protein [uncultured Luteimonas sp.]